MRCYLGIDTSCYYTSAALADEEGSILKNSRIQLNVKKGGLGLRQQEAVFSHIRNLPLLLKELFEEVRSGSFVLSAIGVSDKPRNIEGSYMPVFIAGKSVAESIAQAMNIPVFCFSHQQGHIRAAQIGIEPMDEFIAVHLSGGTTEVLKVSDNCRNIEIVGGTCDINAGQVVDRAGVMMGLGFPAGKELECIAEKAESKDLRYKISVDKNVFNFSGIEAQFKRMFTQGLPHEEAAYGLFAAIGETIGKACKYVLVNHGIDKLLICGGVAANKIVRKYIMEEINAGAANIVSIHFAQNEYSSDNACGIALLAKEEHLNC